MRTKTDRNPDASHKTAFSSQKHIEISKISNESFLITFRAENRTDFWGPTTVRSSRRILFGRRGFEMPFGLQLLSWLGSAGSRGRRGRISLGDLSRGQQATVLSPRRCSRPRVRQIRCQTELRYGWQYGILRLLHLRDENRILEC
jgi:hypothetical protein